MSNNHTNELDLESSISSPNQSIGDPVIRSSIPLTDFPSELQVIPMDTSHKKPGGRKRDPIWLDTTVCEDRRVICNKCHTVIHTHGQTKVERVRAHFANRCLLMKKPKVDHFNCDNDNSNILDNTLSAPNPMKIRRKSDIATKMGIFKRKVAQWFYTTALDFHQVESPMFKAALQVLRPDVIVPTKHELEHELLDIEYNGAIAKLNRLFNEAEVGKIPSCLAIKPWKNTETGIDKINYVAICGNNNYFLTSVAQAYYSFDNGHAINPLMESTFNTATFPDGPEALETILILFKKLHIRAILTPKINELSVTSREIIEKHRNTMQIQMPLFNYGCVFHALNLFAKDICEILPWLNRLISSVQKMLVAFQQFKADNLITTSSNVSFLPLLLTSMQRSSHTSEDDMIHFSSSRICTTLQSLLQCEKQLHEIVCRRDFVSNSTSESSNFQEIQDFVLSETFTQDIEKALDIFSPLQTVNEQLKAGQTSLARVYPAFLELNKTYSSISHANKKERALIAACVMDRLNEIYGAVHGIAYILHPLENTDAVTQLEPTRKVEIESTLQIYFNSSSDFQKNDTLPKLNITNELSRLSDNLRKHQEGNQEVWESLRTGMISPLVFWQNLALSLGDSDWPHFSQFQHLALCVFSLPLGFTPHTLEVDAPRLDYVEEVHAINSAFQNRLGRDQLQKLAHVYCNSHTIYAKKAKQSSSSMLGDTQRVEANVNELLQGTFV